MMMFGNTNQTLITTTSFTTIFAVIGAVIYVLVQLIISTIYLYSEKLSSTTMQNLVKYWPFAPMVLAAILCIVHYSVIIFVFIQTGDFSMGWFTINTIVLIVSTVILAILPIINLAIHTKSSEKARNRWQSTMQLIHGLLTAAISYFAYKFYKWW